MPGVVHLFIWRQVFENGCLELVKQRDIVIFGVSPGEPWANFQSFVRSVSSEYNTTSIQYYEEDTSNRGSKAELPPDPNRVSVLNKDATFSFPRSGQASIIVIISPASVLFERQS